MLNCKQITKLVSESFIRRLSIAERIHLWLHIGMCNTCRLFRRLQIQLQDTVKNNLTKDNADQDELQSQLSITGREKIAAQIKSRLKDD